MKEYITISVPPDLLPQVTGELLRFTSDPNLIEVVHAEQGQAILADPLVAEAWLEYRRLKEEADKAELAPEEPKPSAPPAASEPAPVPAPPAASPPKPPAKN